MIDRTSFVVLCGLLAFTSGLQCPKQKTSPGREVVCYTSVTDVEQLTDAVCKCTTLVHQGYDVRNVSVSDFQDFQKSLKQIIPPLQFVISVNDPSKTLRTSGTVRQEITARLLGVLKEVDGVELNTTAGSKERLVHFVKGLKDELVRKSYDRRIFLVLPTKPEDLAKQFDLKELSKYTDLFTIPTHYLVEDDDVQRTFHPSRLMGLFDMFNADSLIDLISGLGAPKRKILMSVPASAYRFTLKDQDDNASRAPTEETQPVIIDQKQLCDLMDKGVWTVERDEDLTAPYTFKDKMWIAFEDKISVGIKGKYVLLRDLPGLAVHNIENDSKTKCANPLTHEVHHSFSNFKRKSRAAVLNALEDDLHQRELEYSTKVKSSDFRVVRVVDTEGNIRAVRENTQTEFTCSRQGYFVHPKSCNRFYRCVKFNQEIEDYSVFEFDCPAGLSFDERTEVCVWPGSMPEGSPCPGSSEIAPVTRVRFECPSKPGYYADPQNPRWFFACLDLGRAEVMAYEFRCPFGLIFDEQKLVCEWPWLVAGYSGTSYEYGGGIYGSGSTPGTGGYYTGGLPHGYTGTSETGGIGYSGSGGFSGSAGVGQGTIGTGYTSSGGHGISYGVEGTGGYSGTTGSGYSGAAGFDHGISSGGQTTGGYAGKGYSGAGAISYGGQSTTGKGYSGVGGIDHGISYGGQNTGGYSGTTGSGYSGAAGFDHGISFGGQTTGGNSGTVKGYSEGKGIDQGIAYGGQGSTGYTGATGSSHGISYDGQSTGGIGKGYAGAGGIDQGISYGGQSTTGYTGATGSSHGISYGGQSAGGIGKGYAGAGGIDQGISYDGQSTGGIGKGYAGAEGIDQGISHGGQSTTGYTGATGSSHGISYGGQSTGGIGKGYAGVGGIDQGISYGGQSTTGYTGATGSSHGISYGGQSTGGIGKGYAGAGGIDQGIPYGGQSTTGYTGATGSSHGISYGGQSIGGTGKGYAGAGGIDQGISYGGQSTTGYTGATGSSHGISYGGQSTGGYAETGKGYAGAGGIDHGISYGGQSTGGYTGTVQAGADHGYSQTGSGSYGGSSGKTGSFDYAGSSGTGYTGLGQFGSTGTGQISIDTGYKGQGSIGQSGTPGILTGTSYTGTTYSGATGSSSSHGFSGQGFTGQGSETGYSSSAGGYSGTTSSDRGRVTGGYSGTGGGYSETSGTAGKGYSGSSIVYGGSTGGYIGGASGTRVTGTKDYSGGSYPSTPSVQYGGPYGSTVPGSSVGVDYSGTGQVGVTGYGYTAQEGTKYPGASFGHTGIDQTVTQKPIYASTGITGTGIDFGITKEVTQTPGPVFVQKPDQPICITNCYPSGGQTYVPSHGFTSGTNIYQGATGFAGQNISVGRVPSIESTYLGGATPSYVSGAGTILTEQNVQGSITTGDSTPGTLYTYGSASGSILGGSSEQGSIVTGGSRPGYTKTGLGTPGYVITGGVKTVYPGSVSPGTVLHGVPSPGVKVTGAPTTGTGIKGQTSAGIVLTGQTAPGVSIGGSIDQGTIIGSTGHVYTGFATQQGGVTPIFSYGTKVGTVTPSYDTGYKTNEYHDNGGRGTIKFNNGDVTTKYTENDIPDYRPAGGSILPDTLLPGSKGASETSTPRGFAKTGLAVGSTTGTLGGAGSYEISTGRTRPTPRPDHIGTKAFEGNVAGYTKSSTETSVTSTYNQDVSQVDTSKIALGPSKGPGYSYPTPNIPFETGTKNLPVSSTESGSIFGSTPTPFLNVEIYNTPKASGIPSVTSSYQVPTGFTRAPTPPVYTTGPLENYKTTAFEAAKIPFTISTVQPVIDTGYKTVVSSTPIPVTITQDKYSGGIQAGSQFDFETKTSQRGGYKDQGSVPSTTPQTQYIPSKSITPAIGVTYRKPFPLPDVTYQSTPGVYSSTPGYSFESSTGSSIGISRDYNRGSTKYVPSEYDIYSPGSVSGIDYSKSQQGYSSTTTAPVSKTQSPFAVTTYSGVYSKPSSFETYQTTAKSTAVGKGKVIVKWSDLHPVLLGKLGAECTCRGDPFANLRGPGSKLINSSKGKVDLSNYDESDIYVDLEKENSYEENDYATTYESSSSGPVKIWNNQIPKLPSPPSSQVQEKPSSTYLPSFTPSPSPSARGRISGFSNRGITANFRSGKSLNSAGSSTNSIGNANRSTGDGESEEIIDGVTNCARPGLFRHPNFCNKFYACHWDDWKKKFTLHVFNCPVHLTFDNGAAACNWPSMGPACQDNNLLV